MAKPGRDEEFTAYVSGRLSWLRRVAYLLCQDWHRADDLVQTAITRLYVHWRRASAADNLDGYARTVLVRVYLAEQRGGWRRRVRVVRDTPDAAVSDELADLDLRAALAALPPRQRAVVVLRFYCDLSVEQTADALNCSTGTVKSQSARGLAALRRTLRPVEHQGESRA
ncbi:SigE family RNA polymerase sigma factor [Spirillospora albida]|uniref:SigE family RNA polymerase sigma factor n=1 Tax=Spirillospora albida TaxID=58123 RepID=UPI0004C02630|nr:SigE family RNA polymerase sigma factor [Spirillospora albida]